MRGLQRMLRVSLVTVSAMAVLSVTGCETMGRAMEKVGLGGKTAGKTIELSGAHEVPPVSTSATGKSTITVADDKSVSGTVTVEGMTPTAAHIHQGSANVSGPIIIPLTKTSDNSFSVPASTKLTDAQYTAYKQGDLYVNVHSKAHPGGEVRAQLKP